MTYMQQFILDKIDFGTLGILFCLMAVVAGINEFGYIDEVADFLVRKAKKRKKLVLVLVLVCFFLSMLVTNDVALIIIVPFTIQILKNIDATEIMIRSVVLETIAANLGSMMTPIGNPQNVYLYQYYGMNLTDFFLAILPYGIVSLFLIIIVALTGKGSDEEFSLEEKKEKTISANVTGRAKAIKTAVYTALFVLCLLTVLDVVVWWVTFLVVCVVIACCNRYLFKEINYGLLGKFVLLFLLVGNIADIPWIRENLQNVVVGNDFISGIGISQIISNVPAAIMLSQFTGNGLELMLGVNVGGLGTLIASMASMISLEYYTKEETAKKSKYILSFTAYNLMFLVIMLFVRLL